MGHLKFRFGNEITIKMLEKIGNNIYGLQSHANNWKTGNKIQKQNVNEKEKEKENQTTSTWCLQEHR